MDYRENPDKTIEFLDNLEEGDRVRLELSDIEPTSDDEEGLWNRTDKEGTVYNGIVKDRDYRKSSSDVLDIVDGVIISLDRSVTQGFIGVTWNETELIAIYAEHVFALWDGTLDSKEEIAKLNWIELDS